ncbi:hypothetical protein [uncultured Arthrobacter sp.]|uniref:hypothetical protein n=1 Tax=uncultured Arthrobacter sp. TaxID=114050 RepID=UPI0026294C06|nr:hypothetical protein [uncultured Arthrobacter sp.]
MKKLSSEDAETIIDLFEQAQRSASELFIQWKARPESQALFAAKTVEPDKGNPPNPQDFDPAAPPLLGRVDDPQPFSYEQWLKGWCLYQVLVGNVPPPDGHFLEQLDRPAMFDFFEGMIGNGLPDAFEEAYERSTDTLWPLKPREDEPRFLEYAEQLEHAPHRVQLYRATMREVAMDINASESWRQWWLSGPLRAVEFGIAESRAMYPGAAAMHTGQEPTSTRMRKKGLRIIGHITPNLDRILETDESDMPKLVLADLTILLRKVHQKYAFTGQMPAAK